MLGTLLQAYRLERPQEPPVVKRRGPSSYAAVDRGESPDRWRQSDRQSGRNGAGGTAVVSAALVDSPSINADEAATCCCSGGGDDGGEGGGAYAANGGDAIDGPVRQERGKVWYKPPSPAGAAAAAARTGSAVADLRPSGGGFVSTSGGGDGLTNRAADGVSAGEGGVGEACWEEGGTTAEAEGAGVVEVSPPPPASFKVSGRISANFCLCIDWTL